MSAVWEPRGRGLRGFRLSAIETIEAGRPVAEFISVPSLPFLGTGTLTTLVIQYRYQFDIQSPIKATERPAATVQSD